MQLKQFSQMKLLHHLDLAKKIAVGEKPFPISYEIDPSNHCNHDCVWCMYKDLLKQQKTMIEKNAFQDILDQIIELGAKSITLTGGGEPLTNPHTIEYIPYIKQRGVSTALITNGGLLDKKKCKVIAENCSYVRISVDAGCRATHDQLHKVKNNHNGHFQNIIKNIQSLIEWKKILRSNIVIGTGFLVHPENVHEILSFVKKMRKVGADYVQIRPACNLNEAEKGLITLESNGQISEALKMSSLSFSIFPMLNRFDEIRSTERIFDLCRGHALVGVIGADMGVYLCCQLKGRKQYLLGNMKDNTFKEIWLGPERKKITQNLEISNCPPCRYIKYNEILEALSDNDKTHSEFL